MSSNRKSEAKQISAGTSAQGDRQLTTAIFKETVGPYPLGSEVELYEKAIPGGADRLLKLAEARQTMAFQAFQDEIKTRKSLTMLAQALTFPCILVALMVAGWVGLHGNWVTASVIGFVPTATAIGLTYTVSARRRRE